MSLPLSLIARSYPKVKPNQPRSGVTSIAVKSSTESQPLTKYEDMSERRYQIYVTGDILRNLALIAKHESSKPDNQGLTTKYGVEDIAERLLKKLFKENYPQLLKHQQTIDALEKEVLETL